MITVKQYAEERGITIQAVHQSMNGKRKKDRLEGHVQIIDGVKWLDEEAVAILDEARSKSPIVYEKADANERIEELERNEKIMLAKIAAQAEKIAELQQFKLDTLEQRQRIEDEKAQQARREQELDQREHTFAQELAEARTQAWDEAQEKLQETALQAIEAARKETADANNRADRLDQLLGKVQGERDTAELTNKGLVYQNNRLQEENAGKDRLIEELENQTPWAAFWRQFKKWIHSKEQT